MSIGGNRLLVGFAVLLFACGGGDGDRPRADTGPSTALDANGADDASTRDGAIWPDGAITPSGATLVVTTLRGVLGEVFAPASGVAVALDAPGGARMEGTSDATGRVIFEGLDWSLGTADVTAYSEGAALQSIVGIDRTAEVEITLTEYTRFSHSEAIVSGVLRNAEASHGLTVSELGGGAFALPASTSYEIAVPVGVPLTFVAMQDLRTEVPGGHDTNYFWTVTPHDPISANTTVDLDLGVHESPDRAAGSLRLPSGLGLPSFNLAVTSTTGGGIGGATRVRVTPDRLEYEIEFLRLLPEASARFSVVGFTSTIGVYSRATQTGYPSSDGEDVELLAPPEIERPMRGESWALHDPVRWMGDGPLAALYVRHTTDPFDREIVWRVASVGPAHELRVPLPPSSAVDADVIGAEPLVGQVTRFDDTDSRSLWLRAAGSRYFELQP